MESSNLTDNPWRLILSGAAPGKYHMSLDRYLAVGRSPVEMCPTLRLFWWRPAALSLGYHQSGEEIDWESCRRDGVDIVRRPTGGGAILHARELAYSVISPIRERGGAVSGKWLYKQVQSALILALKSIGLVAEIEPVGTFPYLRGAIESFGCFTSSARYEVRVKGRKVVGSAVRRYSSSVLQQGSILLGDSHMRMTRYLRCPERTRRALVEQLGKRSTDISRLAGRRFAPDEIAPHVVSGFEEVFGTQFRNEPVSLEEEIIVVRQMFDCELARAA